MTFKHIMFEWTILIKAHLTTFNILPFTKIKKPVNVNILNYKLRYSKDSRVTYVVTYFCKAPGLNPVGCALIKIDHLKPGEDVSCKS